MAYFTIVPQLRPAAAAKLRDAVPMMTRKPNILAARLAHFVIADSGTVAVNRVFFVGAALALSVALVAIFVFGAEAEPEDVRTPQVQAAEAFRAAHRGQDRSMVLSEGPRAFYAPNEMRNRYGIFSDPRQTSDDDLRNAHRRWVRRVDDPAYSQPGRAQDMVLILEHALAARVLEPHRMR